MCTEEDTLIAAQDFDVRSVKIPSRVGAQRSALDTFNAHHVGPQRTPGEL